MQNKPNAKRTVVDLYNRVAPFYGGTGPNFFKYCGERMVDLGGIFPGARVLDVACGRGASLFPAAQASGASGEGGLTIGVDLAREMLRETEKEARAGGPERISLSQMDGDELGFPSETFDFLLCGFAIFFFPQPDLTLTEWRRVLLPGGKLLVCVVAHSDERWRRFEERLNVYHQQHGFAISPMSEGSEMSRPAEIRSGMLAAGFRESVVLTEDYELIYADERQWWDSKWTHGSRFALENMPAELLERFHRESIGDLSALKQPNGYHEHWQVAWVAGTK